MVNASIVDNGMALSVHHVTKAFKSSGDSSLLNRLQRHKDKANGNGHDADKSKRGDCRPRRQPGGERNEIVGILGPTAPARAP